MTGLSDSERISIMRSAVLIQYMRVTDGQTDGIGVAYTRYSMLSRVKTAAKCSQLWPLTLLYYQTDLAQTTGRNLDSTMWKAWHTTKYCWCNKTHTHNISQSHSIYSISEHLSTEQDFIMHNASRKSSQSCQWIGLALYYYYIYRIQHST